MQLKVLTKILVFCTGTLLWGFCQGFESEEYKNISPINDGHEVEWPFEMFDCHFTDFLHGEVDASKNSFDAIYNQIQTSIDYVNASASQDASFVLCGSSGRGNSLTAALIRFRKADAYADVLTYSYLWNRTMNELEITDEWITLPNGVFAFTKKVITGNPDTELYKYRRNLYVFDPNIPGFIVYGFLLGERLNLVARNAEEVKRMEIPDQLTYSFQDDSTLIISPLTNRLPEIQRELIGTYSLLGEAE